MDLDMKKTWLGLAAIAALAVPQATFAADQAVSYTQAIRCAAVDTLASALYSGDDASAEDKAMAEQYDSVTQKWIGKAGEVGSKAQDAVLADYMGEASSVADQVTSASSGEEAIGKLTGDIVTCTQLEISLFGSSPGID